MNVYYFKLILSNKSAARSVKYLIRVAAVKIQLLFLAFTFQMNQFKPLVPVFQLHKSICKSHFLFLKCYISCHFPCFLQLNLLFKQNKLYFLTKVSSLFKLPGSWHLNWFNFTINLIVFLAKSIFLQ